MSGVTGTEHLRRVAAKLPEVVNRELREELRDAVKDPVPGFRAAVTAAIFADMPSGYAPVFGGSFRIRESAGRGGVASIRLRGSARGRSRNRDSSALNRGILRHKTWGRHPWHTQGITPGFWDEPGEKFVDDVRKAVEQAAEQAAKRVEASL